MHFCLLNIWMLLIQWKLCIIKFGIGHSSEIFYFYRFHVIFLILSAIKSCNQLIHTTLCLFRCTLFILFLSIFFQNKLDRQYEHLRRWVDHLFFFFHWPWWTFMGNGFLFCMCSSDGERGNMIMLTIVKWP